MRKALLLLVLVPGMAGAAELRGGQGEVVVGPGQPIEDDLYVGGGTVQVEAPVHGDLLVSGGTVTVKGPVSGNVMAAGGTVNLEGRVDGSVRAAGGTVVLTGSVARDLVAAGGTVEVGRAGRVGRDAVLAAGQMVLDGSVGRNVRAGGGNLQIGAPVGGDVEAELNQLVLEPDARIAGSVSYSAGQPAKILPGSQVVGTVQRTEARNERSSLATAIWMFFRRLIGFFALGALFLLLLPAVAERSRRELREKPGPSAGFGLLTLVVFPAVALLAVIVGAILGGWWIGVFAFALWALVMAVGFPVAAYWLGGFILSRNGRTASRMLEMLLGIALLSLLPIIPVLGSILLFLAAVMGAGALVLAVARPGDLPESPAAQRSGRGLARSAP